MFGRRTWFTLTCFRVKKYPGFLKNQPGGLFWVLLVFKNLNVLFTSNECVMETN